MRSAIQIAYDGLSTNGTEKVNLVSDRGDREVVGAVDADPPKVRQRVSPPKIRTVHYGLGTIGAEVVRQIFARGDIEMMVAVDTDPTKLGKDLGEIAGLNHNLGIIVAYDLEPTLRQVAGNVVLHVTDSSLTAAYPHLLQFVSAGLNVISNCQELAYPWARYPEISRKLDQRARETGVCILGTGGDASFVMNSMPLFLATACQEIRSVRVTRIVDVASQLELRTKLGIGLSAEGFQKGATSGSIGHAGLRETLFMITDTLGWRLDDAREIIEPVMAQERIKTDYFVVEKHCVAGLRQQARGFSGDRELVHLELEMSLGAKNPRDEIAIDGMPPIQMVVPNGIPGESTLAATMVNCVSTIGRGHYEGLLSMKDMPIAPFRYPGLQPSHETRDSKAI